MGRVAGVLAGLLGWLAGLLPAARRDWVEAVLAEAGEVPAGERGWRGWVGGCGWWHGRP